MHIGAAKVSCISHPVMLVMIIHVCYAYSSS